MYSFLPNLYLQYTAPVWKIYNYQAYSPLRDSRLLKSLGTSLQYGTEGFMGALRQLGTHHVERSKPL